MREIFHQQLTQLGADIDKQAALVSAAISRATTALLESDVAAADQVIAHDTEIDALQRELDEQSVALLAQQQPVATDLRLVVTALRLAATLERMGDLARHIAEIARARFPGRAYPAELESVFAEMCSEVRRVGSQVCEVLLTRDLDVARDIMSLDDALDQCHQRVFAYVLGPDWHGSAQQTVDVTLLSRFLERFGDHGVSVAERVLFLVTGDLDQ